MCAVRDKEGAPGIDEPFALVADKGYHSRNVLKDLPDACTSRISERSVPFLLTFVGRSCLVSAWAVGTMSETAVVSNATRSR